MLANDVRAALVRAGRLAGFRGRSLRRFLAATAEKLATFNDWPDRLTVEEQAETLADYVRTHGRQA